MEELNRINGQSGGSVFGDSVRRRLPTKTKELGFITQVRYTSYLLKKLPKFFLYACHPISKVKPNSNEWTTVLNDKKKTKLVAITNEVCGACSRW